MVAMAVVVRAGIRAGEAALQLGPSLGNVVASPDPVVPPDVHDAQAHGVSVGLAELVGSQQPCQEGLGVGALLRLAHVRHPVEGPTLLVLTLATDVARTGNPDRLGRSVGPLDEVGQLLGADLRRRVALRLALILGIHVVSLGQRLRDRGHGRRGESGARHGRSGHFAGPRRRGPAT